MRTKWMIKVGSGEDLGKRMSVHMRRGRGSYEGGRHWGQLGQHVRVPGLPPSGPPAASSAATSLWLLQWPQLLGWCLALPPLGIGGMHLFLGCRLELQDGGLQGKLESLGGLPRHVSDPQLIFLNFLLWQSIVTVFRTTLSAVSDPALMIHPFKTSITISCLEIKQQKGIQGSKLSKDI